MAVCCRDYSDVLTIFWRYYIDYGDHYALRLYFTNILDQGYGDSYSPGTGPQMNQSSLLFWDESNTNIPTETLKFNSPQKISHYVTM